MNKILKSLGPIIISISVVLGILITIIVSHKDPPINPVITIEGIEYFNISHYLQSNGYTVQEEYKIIKNSDYSVDEHSYAIYNDSDFLGNLTIGLSDVSVTLFMVDHKLSNISLPTSNTLVSLDGVLYAQEVFVVTLINHLHAI